MLAFVLGKTPQHTWHKDLSGQFQHYTDMYLKDDGAVANIFGEEEQVPRDIPFYLKTVTAKSSIHTASVIAIYVGKSRFGFMSTLITKAPFEELELVPMLAR